MESNSMDRALEPLHDATRRLMSAATRQEVCSVAVETARDVLGMPISATWLYDPNEGVLKLAGATEEADELFEEGTVYRPGNSLSWRVFETGEVFTSPDVREEGPVYNPDTVVRAEIVLPLGEYGVMNIGSTDPDAFDGTDVRVARILAANTEAALERAERERSLEIQRDRLDEFVSVVSHDLRNPLAVAKSAVERFEEGAIDREEAVAELTRSHDRMEAIIEDLLTLARQGDVVDDFTTVELGTLAERAWASVETGEATLRIEDEGPISGDYGRLVQVFENLFRNSIEHGSAGDRPAAGYAAERAGRDVTVRVGLLDDGFYVADDGPGIPPDEREAVFDPEYSTGSEGTGFGLAIVRRIAEAHGWTVAVTESEEGGARFEVRGANRPVSSVAGP